MPLRAASHWVPWQLSSSTPCAISGGTTPPTGRCCEGINLSFYPGAKIGVIGSNGSGKSSLLQIMAGEDDGFTGEARLTPGFTVGYLAQEPQLDSTKDVAGNVADGAGEAKALIDRFNEVCAAFGEPDADFDALLAEQSDLQSKIDAAGAWDLERTFEIAMDALRLPPGDAAVATLSGGERRRVALCRLLLSKPDLLLLDEPTNHLDAESVAWLERTLQDYPGTVVAVTHDRYFLDNVAGWILELDRGRRHSMAGQLLLLAGAEAGPAGRRGEGRPVPTGRVSEGAGVDPDVTPGPPEQGEGPHHGVQRPGGRGRGGRASLRQGRDHHSARAAPGGSGGRGRESRQGLRRSLADRRAVVPAASGRHRRCDRSERSGEDDALQDDRRRGQARQRLTRAGSNGRAGLRGPIPGQPGRGGHRLRRDHGRGRPDRGRES